MNIHTTHSGGWIVIRCWFMKIMLFFIVMFRALCLDSPQSSGLQSYSSAIVVSVTYYKQRIFREKAVIVQKCGRNGFGTLLYAFLQCNPYTGPWKLSPIEVLLSSSIKAMFAIELWCYTFPRLYPHPPRLVSYECTTTMAWVMGTKRLFPEQNHYFCGSCRGNFKRPEQLEQTTAITNSFLSILIVKSFCSTSQAPSFSLTQCNIHTREKKKKQEAYREKHRGREREEHRSTTELFPCFKMSTSKRSFSPSVGACWWAVDVSLLQNELGSKAKPRAV